MSSLAVGFHVFKVSAAVRLNNSVRFAARNGIKLLLVAVEGIAFVAFAHVVIISVLRFYRAFVHIDRIFKIYRTVLVVGYGFFHAVVNVENVYDVIVHRQNVIRHGSAVTARNYHKRAHNEHQS